MLASSSMEPTSAVLAMTKKERKLNKKEKRAEATGRPIIDDLAVSYPTNKERIQKEKEKNPEESGIVDDSTPAEEPDIVDDSTPVKRKKWPKKKGKRNKEISSEDYLTRVLFGGNRLQLAVIIRNNLNVSRAEINKLQTAENTQSECERGNANFRLALSNIVISLDTIFKQLQVDKMLGGASPPPDDIRYYFESVTSEHVERKLWLEVEKVRQAGTFVCPNNPSLKLSLFEVWNVIKHSVPIALTTKPIALTAKHSASNSTPQELLSFYHPKIFGEKKVYDYLVTFFDAVVDLSTVAIPLLRPIEVSYDERPIEVSYESLFTISKLGGKNNGMIQFLRNIVNNLKFCFNGCEFSTKCRSLFSNHIHPSLACYYTNYIKNKTRQKHEEDERAKTYIEQNICDSDPSKILHETFLMIHTRFDKSREAIENLQFSDLHLQNSSADFCIALGNMISTLDCLKLHLHFPGKKPSRENHFNFSNIMENHVNNDIWIEIGKVRKAGEFTSLEEDKTAKPDDPNKNISHDLSLHRVWNTIKHSSPITFNDTHGSRFYERTSFYHINLFGCEKGERVYDILATYYNSVAALLKKVLDLRLPRAIAQEFLVKKIVEDVNNIRSSPAVGASVIPVYGEIRHRMDHEQRKQLKNP